MTEYNNDYPAGASSLSVRRIFRTLREYSPVISLSMIAVAVGYLIIAVVAYMMSPSTRVTTMGFRLEFEGAARGEYPNGQKFSAAEIISTPVLVKTFNSNNLDSFTKFSEFASSVFVLQSDSAQDALAREYQARLADTRLNSIDRERIQREYEMKLASLGKDQYAIHYVRKTRSNGIPEVLARKVLHDVLKNWSDFVSHEQHVLEYQVSVLDPQIITNESNAGNPIIETVMLRDKVLRLTENIRQLRMLPAAQLTRTKDGQTLADLDIRLDDVMRFRIDPLVARIADAGLDDRAETIRFVEAQLAYDQRRLTAALGRAEAAQQTLSLYLNSQAKEAREGETATTPAEPRVSGESDSVTPQVSENFIDRLIQLTTLASDTDYRKRLAEEYFEERRNIVPIQQAVAFDESVLGRVREGRSAAADRASVTAEIGATRSEIRAVAVELVALHKEISKNLNPSTQLLTVSTAPYSRVERTVSLKRLVLYGVLMLAVALPVIIAICLLHDHLRRDDEDELLLAQSPSATESR